MKAEIGTIRNPRAQEIWEQIDYAVGKYEWPEIADSVAHLMGSVVEIETQEAFKMPRPGILWEQINRYIDKYPWEECKDVVAALMQRIVAVEYGPE